MLGDSAVQRGRNQTGPVYVVPVSPDAVSHPFIHLSPEPSCDLQALPHQTAEPDLRSSVVKHISGSSPMGCVGKEDRPVLASSGGWSPCHNQVIVPRGTVAIGQQQVLHEPIGKWSTPALLFP